MEDCGNIKLKKYKVPCTVVDILECKKNWEVNGQEGYVPLKSNYDNMACCDVSREMR